MVYPLRLRVNSAALAASASVLLAGCSVHPLPEDVSRASTFDIVQRVRCEAREGLREFATADPDTKKHVKLIVENTAISFDFKFEMTEHNKLSAGDLVLKGIRNNGFFNLDFDASAQKTRKNFRVFQVVEDLVEIARADCSKGATSANWVYPMTGNTGMDEVVRTYIKLEMLSDIKGPGGVGKVKVFGDDLQFRTILKVGATPNLVLSPAGGDLRLKQASIEATAQRDDVHSVIVALARDEKFDVDPAIEKARAKRDKVIANRFARDTRVQAALAQSRADTYSKVFLETQRRRHLKDDKIEEPKYLGEKILEFLRPPVVDE